MTVIHERAYAKVNLCLALGAPREDGRHELVTLFESVTLADEVRIVAPSPAGIDEVVCPAVAGPNLAAAALSNLRVAGWGSAAVRIEIEKRIPIAAGMGGGSADAAAVLRAAPELAPVPESTLHEIAAQLGADVPSQLDPGASIGTGAGDLVSPLPDLAEHALLVIPQPFGLSTADVYREADAMRLPRQASELAALRAKLREAATAALPAERSLPAELLVNDLQPAALALAPQIEHALTAATKAGCERAIVCGSGPTVIGVCWGDGAFGRAQAAQELVERQYPAAIAVRPIRRGDAASSANP